MNSIKRTFSYLKPYLLLATGAFLAMLIVTGCTLLIPTFFQKIIDDGITNQSLDIIKQMTIYLIIIALVRAFFSFCNTYWSQKVSLQIAYDLRNQLYKKLEYLEFSFHDRHNIGQLITRATSDVEAVRNFFATGLLQILAALITFIGTSIILLQMQWKLFLTVFALIPLMMFVFFKIFKKLGPIFGKVQFNLGLLNNILQENLLGARIVKAFTAEPLELERYESQNRKIFDENINVVNTFANGFPIVFLLSNIATLGVIWFGGNMVIDEKLSIGVLVAFNSYLTFLIQPIFQLGFVLQQFSRSNASAKRIFSIIDQRSDIVSPPNAIPMKTTEANTIKFEDVSFSYPEEESNTIEQINLSIEAGSTVALVGATGSGKTTIINLIPRFYDASSGSVLIDEKNVKEYDLDSLRSNIGLVLQDIRLQNSTIRENIAFGRPDATDQEILKACDIAQIGDFIASIPEGLDFQVGEGGKQLSGGQRQRVAIARCLLIKPKILIFDDVTSALDAETEYALKEAMMPFFESGKYTTIVISQKISTIKEADQIIFLKKGKIIARGSHESLLKQSKAYHQFVTSQMLSYAE